MTFAALVFFATATLTLATLFLIRSTESRSDVRDDPVMLLEPRALGDVAHLTAEERRNIEVFRLASRSVVHVTSTGVERGPFVVRASDPPGDGTASGFVWSDRGYIVTNMHVVDGRGGATVTLPDGSIWQAALVSFDRDHDIAVLQIDAPKERLVPIELGRSADLQVGQKVYAIGNPFGLDLTFTVGVISGLNRLILAYNDQEIAGVIQTDAAINPGNSGGPLLNSSGQLIGINTAIHRSSEASRVGFAVPVDIVNEVVPRVIGWGFQAWPELGLVLGSDVFSREQLQYFPNERIRTGLVILEVRPHSPAARAGITPMVVAPNMVGIGDIVIGVDGQEITTREEVSQILGKKEIGDEVTLELISAGHRITKSLVFEQVE